MKCYYIPQNHAGRLTPKNQSGTALYTENFTTCIIIAFLNFPAKNASLIHADFHTAPQNILSEFEWVKPSNISVFS